MSSSSFRHVSAAVAVGLCLILSVCRSMSVWPTVATPSQELCSVIVDHCLEFHAEGGRSFLLERAFERYLALIFYHGKNCRRPSEHKSLEQIFSDERAVRKDGGESSDEDMSNMWDSLSKFPVVSLIRVTVEEDTEIIQLHTNESYTIEMRPSSLHIRCQTVFGAMRALETLSQFVHYNFEYDLYYMHQLPSMIVDKPAFTHRGLLLDTGRHFTPLAGIQHVIRAMSYAKLNVLHWHIVDGQSFPLQPKTYHRLGLGAHSAEERYSTRDIHEIVEFAREHGVRVVLEIDTPSHATSWGVGYPDLLPSNYSDACPRVADCSETTKMPCNIPLDPSSPEVDDIIEEVWRELTHTSVDDKAGPPPLIDEVIHMGGDEPVLDCWRKSNRIKSYMEKNHFNSYEELLVDFIHRINSIGIGLGKRPTIWEEAWGTMPDSLDKRTIVNVWKIPSTPRIVFDATMRGHNVIVNTNMYLDWQDMPWTRMYDIDLLLASPPLSSEQEELVLGGEVSVWSERIDLSNQDSLVWPRAAMGAQLFWNGKQDQSRKSERERNLRIFRCILNRRGVGASAVTSTSPVLIQSPANCYAPFGETIDKSVLWPSLINDYKPYCGKFATHPPDTHPDIISDHKETDSEIVPDDNQAPALSEAPSPKESTDIGKEPDVFPSDTLASKDPDTQLSADDMTIFVWPLLVIVFVLIAVYKFYPSGRGSATGRRRAHP